LRRALIESDDFCKGIINLLHPEDKSRFDHQYLKPFIISTSVKCKDKMPDALLKRGVVCMLGSGVVGVKHVFEEVKCLTHFYQPGDFLFNTEVHKTLNIQESERIIYDEVKLFWINYLDPAFKRNLPEVSIELEIQSSLLSTYQYQGYINKFGIDRQMYCEQWLRDNPKLIGMLSRKELANYFGVSTSSLQVLIKDSLGK
jgi:hypothetical protein